MTTLRCIRKIDTEDESFTVGKNYKVIEESYEMFTVIGDDGDEWNIDKESMVFLGDERVGEFELVEESPAISDEYEEEEWVRIGESLLKRSCVDRLAESFHGTMLERMEGCLENSKEQSEEVCCDVALAYQLSQIQKYIREYDSDIELVVHKDFIAINDEHCREYRGNVEQVIRFIKASGELAKVGDEMDRRN